MLPARFDAMRQCVPTPDLKLVACAEAASGRHAQRAAPCGGVATRHGPLGVAFWEP